ncbi:TetR/AcrR family transcriptional regulator [Sinorhizobium meliloti]|uniref:TetR/AcrR family transcriptional regulator n=1 Tax=Rhizobium meliloti TaxID=382 RepID=UPI003F14F888
MHRKQWSNSSRTQGLMPRSLPTDQENRLRILDASITVCRKQGVKATVSAIARQLHMSPANVYRFFPSKFALHDAVLERVLENSLKAASTNARRPVSAAARLTDHVLGQNRFMLDRMSDDRNLFDLMVVGSKQHWPAAETHRDELQLVARDLIQQGIKAHEFPQQDSALAADCFCASTVILHHPPTVQGAASWMRSVAPDDLISFAIRALRQAECSKTQGAPHLVRARQNASGQDA